MRNEVDNIKLKLINFYPPENSKNNAAYFFLHIYVALQHPSQLT